MRACTTEHDGPLKVVKLDFDAPRFAGGRMQSSREVLMRSDAAACLVHDIERAEGKTFVHPFNAGLSVGQGRVAARIAGGQA